MTAPCSAWATYADLPEESLGMYPETQWCQFLSTATDILWAATGRRYRNQTFTETVTWQHSDHDTWIYLSDPWWSWGGSTYGNPLTIRDATRSIRLPRPNVISVSAVLLDGGVFPGWILNGLVLVRTDGQYWPRELDRMTVTYLFGQVPPVGGVAACVTLAVELARFVSPDPDQSGQLPRRSRSESSRQGGTGARVTDYTKILTDGLTGLYTVDAWIKSVNPKGATQAATVWSPDQPKPIRKV